jgi:hypothetical protein
MGVKVHMLHVHAADDGSVQVPQPVAVLKFWLKKVAMLPSLAALAPRRPRRASLALIVAVFPNARLIISLSYTSPKTTGERAKTSFDAPEAVIPPTTKTMDAFGAATTAWP